VRIHGKREWDQTLGKIECVFSLYDKMRWKWDAVYLPRGRPNIYSMSLIPPPLPLYLRTPTGLLNDILGGRDWLNLEMHLEPGMEWTQRCTARPWSSEIVDELGDRDRVISQMHLEAVIERVWACTWRPRSCELGDALWGCDRASLDEYMEGVDLEGGATAAETQFIG